MSFTFSQRSHLLHVTQSVRLPVWPVNNVLPPPTKHLHVKSPILFSILPDFYFLVKFDYVILLLKSLQ